tara:strand:- start:8823 stop:10049 length:1227 start_codon:yes stop_codon:yes gene_type:complete
MVFSNFDICVVGGGMVGLCLTKQLSIKYGPENIVLIDKEKELGLHSSGRNSGVLHAGIYYKPNSLKADVCIEGAKRLKDWVLKKGLNINECGKIIIPQDEKLDSELDLLLERGKNNGAIVELIDSQQLSELEPQARSATNRALWSPGTCVVNPKQVVKELENEIRESGVQVVLRKNRGGITNINPNKNIVNFSDGTSLTYGFLFNCAGIHAKEIAENFNIGNEYETLPFKGLYWKVKSSSKVRPKRNVYPVPDLSMPFLGVHFTPDTNTPANVYIGPTATPALGRENYFGLEKLEPSIAFNTINTIARKYLLNKSSFRKYVHQQLFLIYKSNLIKSAQSLIPEITKSDIELSEKVGIRPQLYNKITGELEDDFICINGVSSTHVLNAISPAFTASFALADLVISRAAM